MGVEYALPCGNLLNPDEATIVPRAWAGLVGGLPAAAKYPGLLVAFPILAVAWGKWRRSAVAAALAVAGFFVASPFALVHQGETLSDVDRVHERPPEVLPLGLPAPLQDADPRRDVDHLVGLGVDYVAVSGEIADRVLAAREDYPEESRFYDDLERTATRVWRLEPGGDLGGPWVALYRLPAS